MIPSLHVWFVYAPECICCVQPCLCTYSALHPCALASLHVFTKWVCTAENAPKEISDPPHPGGLYLRVWYHNHTQSKKNDSKHLESLLKTLWSFPPCSNGMVKTQPWWWPGWWTTDVFLRPLALATHLSAAQAATGVSSDQTVDLGCPTTLTSLLKVRSSV